MYLVTKNDVESYWEKGYWISPKLLDDDQIARLRAAIQRLFDGDFDGNGSLFNGPLTAPSDPLALRRVINGWWVNNEIRATVLNPELGRIAADLMRVPSVRLWADQVLEKPGTAGASATNVANIGWHQDANYWHINSQRENMVTAWIALQDTDLGNGGMRTLEGSHKWGLIEDSDKFYDPDLDSQRSYFEGRVEGKWTDEPCLLKAGQASFHQSLCFHGSEVNKSDSPRMSIVGHYMPDGAVFRPSGKYQVFLPLLGPWPQAGQPFAGNAFPLVYPASL